MEDVTTNNRSFCAADDEFALKVYLSLINIAALPFGQSEVSSESEGSSIVPPGVPGMCTTILLGTSMLPTTC